jgi:hypothetical protein
VAEGREDERTLLGYPIGRAKPGDLTFEVPKFALDPFEGLTDVEIVQLMREIELLFGNGDPANPPRGL